LEQLDGGAEIALDAESVEHRLDSMVIKAGTASELIQEQLTARHDKIMARTAARNQRRHDQISERLEAEARETMDRLNHAKEENQQLEVHVMDLILNASMDAATLQEQLSKRKEDVLERTRLRNEKRRAKAQTHCDREQQHIQSKLASGAVSEDIHLSANVDDELPIHEKEEELHLMQANKAMDARVTAIQIRSDMSQQEVQAQLLKRRQVMVARTKARANARTAKKMAHRRKEQEAAMSPEVRRQSMGLNSLKAMVNLAASKVITNENKVAHLEAEANVHMQELKESQAKKVEEKHRRLQARLAAKHNKKKSSNAQQ